MEELIDWYNKQIKINEKRQRMNEKNEKGKDKNRNDWSVQEIDEKKRKIMENHIN